MFNSFNSHNCPRQYRLLSHFRDVHRKFEKLTHRDFPGGRVVKNPPANTGDMGSSPGPGRSHMPRGN